MSKLTKLTKTTWQTLMFAAAVSQVVQAGVFTPNDLYLGFTQSSAQSDYVIDLGQPMSVGVGGSSVVDFGSYFSLATFNSIFAGGANGVTVAVVGANNDNTTDPFGVFATQVRTNGVGIASVPGSNLSTKSHSTAAMSGGAGEVAAILASTVNGLPTAGQSVVDSTKSYSSLVDKLQVQNNFIGKTGVIPFGIFGSSAILYLDLYKATTSVPYTYLGYFTMDLSTSSPKLTFTPSGAASSAPPPPPPQLSVGRSGSTTTISFGTTNGATYTLHYTNSAGLSAPVTAWPSLPPTVTGDGSTKSFTDTTTDADRVYRVAAH